MTNSQPRGPPTLARSPKHTPTAPRNEVRNITSGNITRARGEAGRRRGVTREEGAKGGRKGGKQARERARKGKKGERKGEEKGKKGSKQERK